MDFTYIVSGFPRTGTSSMMKALEAGGMNVSYDREVDKVNNKKYGLNQEFFELSKGWWGEYGFPRRFVGKVIKALHGTVHFFPVGRYKIVYLVRNIEDIQVSYETAFKTKFRIHNYEQQVRDEIEKLRNRRDVCCVTVIHFNELVNNPEIVFRKLRNREWDVDVDKAVHVIKSYKKEPELVQLR